MKRARILLLALVITTMTVVSSCSDRTPFGLDQNQVAVKQAPKPQADLVGGLLDGVLKATGLLKCQALPYASETQVIGKAGGVMHIGPHTFTVPAGALNKPVAITGTIPADQDVDVIFFEPSGLQFSTPASLRMNYGNCGLLGIVLPKQIAIVDNNLGILGYLLSLDNILSKYVTGQVPHFTGYAIAW
nr:hypothetical protein Hi04_10k_c554_00021 [uncultured bacterium]